MNLLMDEEQILLTVIKLLRDNKIKDLESLIDELQPYDIANVYKDLPQNCGYALFII